MVGCTAFAVTAESLQTIPDCRCYCTTLHVGPSTVTLAAGCYVYPSKMEQVTNSRNHMHCFDACFESCELQALYRQQQKQQPENASRKQFGSLITR